MIQIFKKRHTKVIASTFIIVLAFVQCAVISSPTGGERDKTPPKLVVESPANKTTNFSGNQIHLQFDEYVQVNNLQNIIVSPKLEYRPKIEAKKNDIFISFKEILDSNTTYSIFFGDNIVDVNESNPFTNYAFVFSTGNQIDSLKLKAKIEFKETNIPENTYLLLYKNLNDSAFLKEAPFYLSKIATDGTAEIKHLKQGTYACYALTDFNNNYYYDLPNENIAFLDSFIVIDSTLPTLNMQLFTPEPSTLKVMQKDKQISNNQMSITWNKTLSPNKDQIFIKVISDTTINTSTFPVAEHKSLVYFTNLNQDSGALNLHVYHNKVLIDSFSMNISTAKKEMLPFFNDTIVYKVFEGTALQLKSHLFSLFDIDTSKVMLLDSTATPQAFTIEKKNDWQSYNIFSKWNPDEKYELVLKDSFLVDFGQNYAKSQQISILGQSIKKTGNLLINIELQEKTVNLIANLKDNQGKVLEQQFLRDSQTLQIQYKSLPAGQYQIEFIKDDNDDQIWNSGNFQNKTLPEKTYISQPIIIKENWDTEENIKIDFNQKIKSNINKNTKSETPNNVENGINEIPNKTNVPFNKGTLKK